MASVLPANPPQASEGRISAWIASRLPRQDTQVLTQRNVYIMPSKAGWMLALVLVVLLVASINFELNLGYLLTFLLAGSALASMHVAHGTLRGLALHLAPPAPCFAGAAAALEIQLSSDRASPRYAIGVGLQGAEPGAWTDVPGGGQSTVHISWLPPGRGRHSLPTLQAQTRFPMGTFRVWTLWRPATPLLVYPEPEAHPPALPPGEPRAGSAPAGAPSQGPGEVDGVRVYQRGDPLRLVVWKKAARAIAAGSDELVSRDTHQPRYQDLWFDLSHTGAPSIEQRLSRICAWVLLAERTGTDYGLRLPGLTLAPSQGAAHRHRCLEALALC
ncbi:MAG: DUF58 domain-containing protein [Pseudomonadota bacterium]